MSQERQYANRECAETSGFLFPHPCYQIAAGACHHCGKPICNQHMELDNQGGTLCTSCAASQSSQDPTMIPDTEIPDAGAPASGSRASSPYWYSRRSYPGYTWHDHGDFTAGDEAVLRDAQQDDDVAWEKDMGAS